MSKSRARGPESHFSETATAVDRSLPSIISQQPQRTTASAYEANQSPHDNKTAKTIVGTLIGAAAGAAVAYAMTKSEPQSENSPDPTRAPEREYPQLLPSQAQSPERQDYRAVEAPARSIYSQAPSEARPGLMTRSVSSKNPRASTAYTGTGSEYPHGPVPENIHQYDYDDIPRRQSDGSIYTTRDLPIRAIEYRPDSHAHAYPQPTLISSFGERSRTGTGTGTGTGKPGSGSRSGSIYSTSTIKPSKSKSHCSTATFTPTPNRAGDSTTSTNTAHRIPLPQSTTPSVSSYRSTKSQESARNVPLPESVAGRSSSGVSARHVPLPESVAGGSSSRASSSSKVYSYSPSKAGSNANSMASSKRSAAFEEPVRPCDSISQVSSNRTVKAAGSRC